MLYPGWMTNFSTWPKGSTVSCSIYSTNERSLRRWSRLWIWWKNVPDRVHYLGKWMLWRSFTRLSMTLKICGVRIRWATTCSSGAVLIGMSLKPAFLPLTVKLETASILHSKYYEIKFILREERGKYNPVLRALDNQLQNQRRELGQLQKMLADAVVVRNGTFWNSYIRKMQ